jgi:hypothetical protein
MENVPLTANKSEKNSLVLQLKKELQISKKREKFFLLLAALRSRISLMRLAVPTPQH